MPASSPAAHPPLLPPSVSRRLRAGYHLFPAAADGWLILQPDGVFLRLHLPAASLGELAAHLRGESPPPLPGAGLAELLERFAERGLLEPEAAPPGAEGRPRRLFLEGEGPVLEALARLLPGEEFELCRRPAAGEAAGIPAGTELVVSCAGWLPDGRWSEIDRACHQRSIAWHGCHAEGERFYLGPFFLPGDPATARYADVRARRLAAETHPDGLEAYWRYADGGRTPPPPWPGPGPTAMIAGALAADIAAWARGAEPPSHGFQLAFHPARLEWRRHPVLPVPRGLMTEAAP